jgi:large subunit ribosomal protein L29
MKPKEIRELSLEEKLRKANGFKEELFNLRFQHEIGQLENSQKMKQIKRDIARVKTIIKESKLNQKIGQE